MFLFFSFLFSNNNYLQIDYISILAFRFLAVSGPEKPLKTDKNPETRKLGDPGLISRKPHIATYSINLRNQRKL